MMVRMNSARAAQTWKTNIPPAGAARGGGCSWAVSLVKIRGCWRGARGAYAEDGQASGVQCPVRSTAGAPCEFSGGALGMRKATPGGVAPGAAGVSPAVLDEL